MRPRTVVQAVAADHHARMPQRRRDGRPELGLRGPPRVDHQGPREFPAHEVHGRLAGRTAALFGDLEGRGRPAGETGVDLMREELPEALMVYPWGPTEAE